MGYAVMMIGIERFAGMPGAGSEDSSRSFGMNWDSTEKERGIRYWNEMYVAAAQYARTHGGSMGNISSGYVTKDGKKLGQWIGQQRRIRRGSIRHSILMTEERIRMLDSIGMKWGGQLDCTE